MACLDSLVVQGWCSKLGPLPARQSLLLLVLVVSAGCSGRRVPVPALSADSAGREALVQLDVNKDGYLDSYELKRCPALGGALKALDRDGDGKLSASEISERVKSYQNSRIGLMALTVKLTVNRRPLEGATVTLTPERFLGDALQPATGTTDKSGVANVATAGAAAPGVPCGIFRVEVSKKSADGRELLPAIYNQASVLGVEVGPDFQGVLRLALRGS